MVSAHYYAGIAIVRDQEVCGVSRHKLATQSSHTLIMLLSVIT